MWKSGESPRAARKIYPQGGVGKITACAQGGKGPFEGAVFPQKIFPQSTSPVNSMRARHSVVVTPLGTARYRSCGGDINLLGRAPEFQVILKSRPMSLV